MVLPNHKPNPYSKLKIWLIFLCMSMLHFLPLNYNFCITSNICTNINKAQSKNPLFPEVKQSSKSNCHLKFLVYINSTKLTLVCLNIIY